MISMEECSGLGAAVVYRGGEEGLERGMELKLEGGSLYSEVQYIMGNSHMTSPPNGADIWWLPGGGQWDT